jgi:large subunit ribosomal protein L6
VKFGKKYMSRIGKKIIQIPEGVEVIIDGYKVTVKGPKGELVRIFLPDVKIEQKDKELIVSPAFESKRKNAIWGLSRALLNNMVEGVKNGFEKKLEMVGIGYRAVVEGTDLTLYAGFSHPVKVKCPEGLKFLVEKNVITISGVDKELVGLQASQIRKIRKPEPYKGKGIRYQGEVVRIKAGKRVATTAK